jgi:hypothetical protein
MTGQVINLVYLLQSRPLSEHVPTEEGRGEGKSESVSALSAAVYTTTFLMMLAYGAPLLLCPSKILRQGN